MNKKAFTLIELLVVVLIIGILAAIALPMYTKTVFKARFSQVQLALDAAKKTGLMYYMENGSDGNLNDSCDSDDAGGMCNLTGLTIFNGAYRDENKGWACDDWQYEVGDNAYKHGKHFRVVCTYESGSQPRFAVGMNVYYDGYTDHYCMDVGDGPSTTDEEQLWRIARCKSVGYTEWAEESSEDAVCDDAWGSNCLRRP